MNLSAVILAGGESSRMGRDKAWIEADGTPLIFRALFTVRELPLQEVFISGRAGTDYSGLQCPVLFDLEPGCGPLGGIERALQAASSPLVLVLAVDLPNLTTAFLRKLMQRCDALTGAVPKLRGTLEPLAAIYPRRCHLIACDCLVKGRRARDFAEVCIREHAVRTFPVPPGDFACFENWNSPDDVGRGGPSAPSTSENENLAGPSRIRRQDQRSGKPNNQNETQ
jgi:molybdopterin-guanine dinucleotide biosynthesis protein A